MVLIDICRQCCRFRTYGSMGGRQLSASCKNSAKSFSFAVAGKTAGPGAPFEKLVKSKDKCIREEARTKHCSTFYSLLHTRSAGVFDFESWVDVKEVSWKKLERTEQSAFERYVFSTGFCNPCRKRCWCFKPCLVIYIEICFERAWWVWTSMSFGEIQHRWEAEILDEPGDVPQDGLVETQKTSLSIYALVIVMEMGVTV